MNIILTIMVIMAVLLIVIVYVNEKVIVKLPESSAVKSFWRKHICEEDEIHN
jgi:biopolymer transport protein ExbD